MNGMSWQEINEMNKPFLFMMQNQGAQNQQPPATQYQQHPTFQNQAQNGNDDDEEDRSGDEDEDKDEGEIFDGEEEDETQTLGIPNILNQRHLPLSSIVSSPANTNDKVANEAKANILRARLIAMRASTPARDKAVRESINTFTDIDSIDSLVEQGKTAAANAEMVNNLQLSSTPAVPPQNIESPVIGLPPPSALEDIQALSRTGVQERMPTINLANELREYQKLQQLSSKMTFQDERLGNSTKATQNGSSTNTSLEIRTSSETTPSLTNSRTNLVPDTNNGVLQREPGTSRAREAQTSRHSPHAIPVLTLAPSTRTVADSAVSSVVHAAEPASEDRSDGLHEAVHDAGTHRSQNDIDDWLELSGFNNMPYREKKLEMYRKYQAVLAQQAEMEREMQLEGGFAFRFQSAQPMEDIKPSITVKLPPPSLPTNKQDSTMRGASPEFRIKSLAHHADTPIDDFSTSYSSGRVKRPRSPEQDLQRHAPPEKQIRTERPGIESAYNNRNNRGRSPQASSPTRSSYNRKESNWPRGNEPLERRISIPDSNDDRFSNHARRRGSFENGDRAQASRRNDYYNGPIGANALKLRDGGVRYFLIKSWNHDNVAEAQDECVWATQEKNTETLVNAFKTCRHVVLVFSVNNSRGFQGYATMATLPFSTIPTPRWVNTLHWSTSLPFRIRWHATGTTHFQKVGHLNNAFNEGLSVIVGRDCQEIEPGVGGMLCEYLDGGERW